MEYDYVLPIPVWSFPIDSSYHGLCSTTVDKCRVVGGKLRGDVGA